jgi:Ca2+-transporting ATPase
MSAATLQQEQIPAYQQPVDEVLAALDTEARSGLSPWEARARLERYGTNELTAETPVPAWRKFWLFGKCCGNESGGMGKWPP